MEEEIFNRKSGEGSEGKRKWRIKERLDFKRKWKCSTERIDSGRRKERG